MDGKLKGLREVKIMKWGRVGAVLDCVVVHYAVDLVCSDAGADDAVRLIDYLPP